jgi:hypothetical protein
VNFVGVSGRIDHHCSSGYETAGGYRMQLPPASFKHDFDYFERQGHMKAVVGSRVKMRKFPLDHEGFAWAGNKVVSQPQCPRARHGDDTGTLLHTLQSEYDARQRLTRPNITGLLIQLSMWIRLRSGRLRSLTAR